MKKLIFVLCLLLIATPSFAYVITSVQSNLGKTVSADTVKLGTTAKVIGKDLAIYEINITPSRNNTTEVWIGNSSVGVNAGYLLVSGTNVTINADNLTDIYAVAISGTPSINFITSNQ